MTTTANTITLKGDVMTYEEQVYNGDVLIGSTGAMELQELYYQWTLR